MRDGYKVTEFGEIPAEWEVVRVQDIADVKGGKRLPKGEVLTQDLTDHPYIRVADMYRGTVRLKNILYVPDEVFPSISRYTISKNDIFISVAGTLGIVGCVPEELDGANLTENANKLTNIKINQRFLFYLMSSWIVQDLIKKEQTNNAQPKLALIRIRDFIIPSPPAAEQRKIASILSIIDEKIEVLDEQIKQTQELKKGLMQRLLTEGIGHTKFRSSVLGEIPESWEVLKLRSVGTFAKGNGISKKELSVEGFPCVRYGEIYTRHDILIKQFYSFIDATVATTSRLVQSGDILFAGSGETAEDIGKAVTYIGDEKVYAGGDIIILTPEKADSLYLSYCLNSNIVITQRRKYAQGNSVVHIYSRNLAKIRIPLPPLPEQRNIAFILSTVDEKIDILKSKKQTYHRLKKGLMQQLLTGKVRVKIHQQETSLA